MSEDQEMLDAETTVEEVCPDLVNESHFVFSTVET